MLHFAFLKKVLLTLMILKEIEIYLILEAKTGDNPLIGGCMVQVGAKRETTLKFKRLTYERKKCYKLERHEELIYQLLN